MNNIAMDSVSQFFTTSALIFFRLLPIWIVSPIVMFRRIPLVARVTLGILIAIILTTGYENTPNHIISSLNWLSLVSEFLLGLILAFGFHVAQGSVQTMGHIIDQQIGFSAGSVFDPGTEQTQSLIGELLILAIAFVFLSLNVHHALLRGVASTINLVPLGQPLRLNIDGLWQILSTQFALGFALACPVILSLWLIDIILALTSRSLPQANIYFVAMPIKIVIGLILVVWLTNHILPQINRMFEFIFDSWPMLFQEL